jgi:hypothetical protein
MKDKKKLNKPTQATDAEIYMPDYDIEEILNDPLIQEQYEKYFKTETFPSFTTKKLKLALKVIRGQNEEGESQRVGDKIEKELNRRKEEKITKKSILTKKDISNFWKRLYLGDDPDIMDSCIKRAYRDFNRTMHGIGKKQNPDRYYKINWFMRLTINQIYDKQFKNQSDYDIWHEKKCMELIDEFHKIYKFKIHIGQAQKWINMSLKYLYASRYLKDQVFEDNYSFFHIPIDNIIQEKLVKHKIPKLKTSWSRIATYHEYFDYQKLVRKKFEQEIPMDVEFKLFNDMKRPFPKIPKKLLDSI